MKVMKHMLAIAGLALIMASCSNSTYEKTASGLAYKIIKGDDKQKLKAGDIVKIRVTIKLAPKDSVLFETGKHLPVYVMVDTSSKLTHDFNEVLKLCSVGDSLVTVAQLDTMVKKNMVAYNNMFKRGDQIITSIKVLKTFTQQEQAKDQEAEMAIETKTEVAELQKFVSGKGVKAQKTQNGVFVEILNPGSSDKAVAGKQVTVNYTGSLIENGKVFDSNIDTAFKHVQPYKLVVGAGQSIPGWEEGIQLLGKGGKGTLYIPAMMGYGARGAAPVIPPYSNLKFTIEVLDVTDAPKAAPNAMPPGMQEQIQKMRQSGGQTPPKR